MAAAGQRPESSAASESQRALQDQLALSEELDRALERLRSPERQAVVLRYFAGKSFAQVALELHLTEEAARKRVSRGLEKLRILLRPAAGDSVMVPGVSGLACIERLLTASLQPAPAALTPATLKAVAAIPITAGVSATFAKGALITMAITKGKTIAAGVLVLLLACGGGAVAYRELRPPVNRTVVLQAGNPSVPVPSPWQPRFNEVYGLREREVLRNVKAPFIPERQAFWNSEQRRYGGQGSPLSESECLTVEWDGTAGHWSSLSANQNSLANVVQMCVQVKGWEMDLSTLGLLPMPGDWVFRKGATAQQKMDALAQLISGRLGRTVRLVQRSTMHDTIVVSGSYAFSPLEGRPDNGVIEFIGEPETGQQPSPKEHSTLGILFRMLADCTNTPVVDQANVSRKAVWLRQHQSISDSQRLLANVIKQTGLTVAHEQRPVDMWTMVDEAGNPTTLEPPAFVKAYALGPGEFARCMRPPFGPERQQYWDSTAGQPETPLTPATRMLLEWDGRSLHMRIAEPRLTLEHVLEYGADLGPLEFDASLPFNLVMDADVVVRADVPAAERLAGISMIVSENLGKPVHFEQRRATSDVIVVSGKATASTRPSADVKPLVFAGEAEPGPRQDVLHTRIDSFLRQVLPHLLNRRVVDEVDGSGINVAWRGGSSGQAQIDAILEQLSNQTGLQCRQERREIDTWVLADGPGPSLNGPNRH